MAAPECEREAKKRRERKDSGCAHERKERRPHSEERIQPPPSTPPLHDHNRLENERRAERLSKSRRPQHGGKRRRPPTRLPRHPDENNCSNEYNNNSNHSNSVEELRCSTPPIFNTIVFQDKPISEEHTTYPTSLDEEAERARRDERSSAQRLPQRRDQPCPDKRLDKITKKISILKKNIAKYENEFKVKNGCPMSPSDKITDVHLTKMLEALKKLQTEKRWLKTDPIEYELNIQALKQQKERDDRLETALKSEKTMPEVIPDIEEWLEGCRKAEGRSSVPETSWTASQLATEKSCVQKVLLRLEAARGRPPAHSAERGAARHLYERYRTVKKTLATFKNDAIIGINNELETIHEHETMLFNSSVDSSSDSQEKPSETSQETIDTPLQSPPAPEDAPSPASSARSGPTSDEAACTNEGLHCLGLEDLTKALIEAKLQKCVLRRAIKEYEVSFELLNSRKIQRDDKKGKEEEYMKYKAIKARIKLLNALITKQKG